MADDDAGINRHGKLSYIQIPAHDTQQFAAFYEAVFGWTTRGTPEHLSFTDASGELSGAWETGRAISAEPGILPFISVRSVSEAVAAIVSHGGQVVRAPYHEGDLTVATFRDPAGNVLGAWQMGHEAGRG